MPTAVVAHDAGAANLIISWLSAWKWPVRVCVQGPAKKLWENAFPNKRLFDTPEEAMQGCASLLTGTGWASSLEHDARRVGRRQSLYVAAVIDHWVNYPLRFERDGQTEWPDEIWLVDHWAERIARQTLPPLQIRRLENLYLRSQLTRIGPPPDDGTLLYVLEPVRNNWGRGSTGEFQALDYTLSNISKLNRQPIRKILLRPHPSEASDKYEEYLKVDARIVMDDSVDMAAAISQADIVVGVESFALVMALSAGRSVFSSLPPWAPTLRLPHPEIKQMREI